uniref:Putative homing endonuclease n=1 Tax=viral metagenome TaxID=1070528 RepID=A0A6M3MAQ7_9ZZZZ
MKQLEEWRIVTEFPKYEISNLGRIKSKWSQKCPEGKILQPRWTSWGGYMMVALYDEKRRKDRLIHHLVLEEFVCLCPFGCEAHHKDGNKINNEVENLEWVHHFENIGCSHGKLTRDQIIEIRQQKIEGTSMKDLARKFGVTYRNIVYITQKGTWRTT